MRGRAFEFDSCLRLRDQIYYRKSVAFLTLEVDLNRNWKSLSHIFFRTWHSCCNITCEIRGKHIYNTDKIHLRIYLLYIENRVFLLECLFHRFACHKTTFWAASIWVSYGSSSTFCLFWSVSCGESVRVFIGKQRSGTKRSSSAVENKFKVTPSGIIFT